MMRKGEKTKQRILEAAYQMFWKGSYHSVRVDKIVELASVNKASFYQYFKNKEQAALEGIEHMFELTKDHVFEASLQTHQNPIDRLDDIFKRIYLTHKNLKAKEGRSPGCPFVNIGNELATDSELIRTKVENIFDEFCTYHQNIYEDAYKQGLTTTDWDSEEIGRHLQGILNGAMISAKVRNNPEEILKAAKVAKAVIGVPV